MLYNATTVVRAAAGDMNAWNLLRRTDPRCMRYATALLMLDESAPPTAVLYAFAVFADEAPAALHIRAQRAARAITDEDAPALSGMPAPIAAHLVCAFGNILSGASRQALLAAFENDPKMIRHVAERAWDALSRHERTALAHAAAQTEDYTCIGELLVRVLTEGSDAGGESDCAELLNAARRTPVAAAIAIERLGAAGFSALDERMRTALLDAASHEPIAAARVINALGVDTLAILPDAERAALLDAVVQSAFSAASVIKGLRAAGLAALDATSRANLIRSAASAYDAAAFAIKILGATAFAELDADDREALILSAASHPDGAASVIAALGADGFAALSDSQRARLIRSATAWSSAASSIIKTLGAKRLMGFAAEWRAAIIQAGMMKDGWRVSDEAVAIALAAEPNLSESERHALRAAILGPDEDLVVSSALVQGASMRSWMVPFVNESDNKDRATQRPKQRNR